MPKKLIINEEEDEAPPEDARPPHRPDNVLDPNSTIMEALQSLKKSGLKVKSIPPEVKR